MPRIARKDSKSKFYHIVVQGINKEYIFEREEYIQKYKNIILQKLDDSNITILAYCIMINHAHFLIYSDEVTNISKFMQKVNTSYSMFFNKANKRVGYVFRDRYYSQDIMNENHLYNCLRYIHNNPVKAKIVKNMNEYKYSSYNEFLEENDIINEKSLKLLFGTTTNFEEQFKLIHNTKLYQDGDFFDLKEKDIRDYINEVEKEYNKKISDIVKDKNVLKDVIKEARAQTNVTIRELAELLDISKSNVGKYIKK